MTLTEAETLPVEDTPFVAVDLDVVGRNIARFQAYADEHGLALRPHVKTHKVPQLARLQVEAGAVGITCQKLGEAEVMADAGLDDILVSFPIVGAAKVERLVALAARATVTVTGDSEVVARGLSGPLAAAGLAVGFLVECDTGFGRTGVQSPGAAAELAELVERLPGLRFDGLLTYPTLPTTTTFFRAALAELDARGIPARTVSAGGTPAFFSSHLTPELTEVRPGTYVYGDRACLANGTAALEDCALRVHATVVSRPTAERAILDAGSKTLTSDPVGGEGAGHGLIVEYPDARLARLSEEHGIVELMAGAPRPEVGEIVTIVPNHACGCVNLHDEMVVVRGGSSVGVWPVVARGLVR